MINSKVVFSSDVKLGYVHLMNMIPIHNLNMEEVGYIDEKEFSYRYLINYNTQMFHRFQNSIGKSVYILNKLLSLQEQHKREITFKLQIINYPNEPSFIAIISLNDFIANGKNYLKYLITNYKKEGVIITPEWIKFNGKNTDKQILCPLTHFSRVYFHDKNISEI